MKTEFAGNEIEIIMVCNRKNHTKKSIEYIYLEIYAYIGFIFGKGSLTKKVGKSPLGGWGVGGSLPISPFLDTFFIQFFKFINMEKNPLP